MLKSWVGERTLRVAVGRPVAVAVIEFSPAGNGNAGPGAEQTAPEGRE